MPARIFGQAPTLSGVKEDIILQAYTGKSSFSFTVKTNGLEIIQQDGDTFLADFEGNKVASLGKVVITDKVGKTVYGSMTVVTKTEREEYTVTINAPTAFLTSATTVYPVTVDPTLTINEEFASDPGYYEAAIEDLCIYNGTSSPSLSGYEYKVLLGDYETDEYGVNYSRMLYKFSDSFISLQSLDSYINSSVLYRATLNVYGSVANYETRVYSAPYYGDWVSGYCSKIYLEPQDYYNYLYESSTLISNTADSFIEIDVTPTFQYWSTATLDNISEGLVLSASYEGGSVDENYINQVRIFSEENNSYNIFFSIDYKRFDGVRIVKEYNNDTYMEYSSTSNSVTCAKFSDVGNQQWLFEYVGNDCYYIKPSIESNKYLTTSTSNAITEAQINTTNLSNRFKWKLTYISSNRYTIKNLESNKYLARNTGQLVLQNSLNSNAYWEISQLTAPYSNNIYYIERYYGDGESDRGWLSVRKDLKLLAEIDFKVAFNENNVLTSVGGQLWAFDNVVDDYYRIVSLDYNKANSVDNTVNLQALTASSDSSVGLANYTGSSNQLWKIIYDSGGGFYRLNNRSVSGKSLYFSQDVCNLQSSSYTKLFISEPTGLPSCTYSSTYKNHTRGEILNLKIIIESGLDTTITDLIYETACVWNGLSDNVRIYTTEENIPDNAYAITFMPNTLASNVLGETQGLYENVPKTITQLWDEAIIYLNNDVLRNSDEKVIRMTIAHEMGHVLKLKHPINAGIGKDGDQKQILSVMNQEQTNILVAPTPFDIYFLKQRWG